MATDYKNINANTTFDQDTKVGVNIHARGAEYFGSLDDRTILTSSNVSLDSGSAAAYHAIETKSGKRWVVNANYMNNAGEYSGGVGVLKETKNDMTVTNAGYNEFRTSNPLVFGGNLATKEIANNSNYVYFNAQNGGAAGLVQSKTKAYGGGLTLNENLDVGVSVNALYTKSTKNIIEIEGHTTAINVGLNVTGVNGSIHHRRTVPKDVDGTNGAGITSAYASTIHWGVGATSNGIPLLNLGWTTMKNGYSRKVDVLGAFNVFNVPGFTATWSDILFPKKEEIPRFEVIRPTDDIRVKPHEDMFADKAVMLNRTGQQQLTELIANLADNMKRTPNEKFILELGAYSDNRKKETNPELTEARQQVVQKHIDSLAKQYGIPTENIEIRFGHSKIDASDKRLHLQDQNTNIRIITTSPEIGLRDNHGNIAHFNAVRTSPAGEQAFVDIKNSVEFEKFLKSNKIKGSVEHEMLANYVFDEIYLKKKSQSIDEALEKAKQNIYDKGATLKEQFTNRSIDTITKITYQELEKSKELIATIKAMRPDITDSDVKKTLKDMSAFISGKAMTDMEFQNKLQAAEMHLQQNGLPITQKHVIALGLQEYEKSFLAHGVLRTDLKNKVKEMDLFFDKLRDTPIESLKDEPTLVRLKQQIELNSKKENEKLVVQLIEDSIKFGVINKKADDLAKVIYPAMDVTLYAQKRSLESGNVLEEYKNSHTNNLEAQLLQKSFKSSWSGMKGDVYKMAEKLLDANPEMREKHSSKSILSNVEQSLKTVYPYLPKVDVPSGVVGKDAIKQGLPVELLNDLGGRIVNAIANKKIDPDSLNEIFPAGIAVLHQIVKIQSLPANDESKVKLEQQVTPLINKINNDPQLAQISKEIIEPFFTEKFMPIVMKNINDSTELVNQVKQQYNSANGFDFSRNAISEADNRIKNYSQKSIGAVIFQQANEDAVTDLQKPQAQPNEQKVTVEQPKVIAEQPKEEKLDVEKTPTPVNVAPAINNHDVKAETAPVEQKVETTSVKMETSTSETTPQNEPKVAEIPTTSAFETKDEVTQSKQEANVVSNSDVNISALNNAINKQQAAINDEAEKQRIALEQQQKQAMESRSELNNKF